MRCGISRGFCVRFFRHWWRGRVEWQKDKNTKTRNRQILSKDNRKRKHLELGLRLGLALGLVGGWTGFVHAFVSLSRLLVHNPRLT